MLLPQSRFHWYKMGTCSFFTFPQWPASLSVNMGIGNYKFRITDFLVPLLKPLNTLGPSPHCSSLPLAKKKRWVSVQFSSLSRIRLHGLQYARLPCLSPTPGAYSNSYPLSWWWHPTISSSVVPVFSQIQSFPSIRVFSNESVLRIRWTKYWSFSFNISISNEYSGLISFRMNWLDLLTVQGTFKSILQHHRSKASIFRCLAFFIVQLSYPYMTTRKTIALTRWTFVSKVMSVF